MENCNYISCVVGVGGEGILNNGICIEADNCGKTGKTLLSAATE